MRIGKSVDIHRLEKGLPLIIGGVNIESKLGAIAHSDGDCLLHTVAESLIGALSLGDLGKLFPDTDNQFENVSSSILVTKVIELISSRGYKVVNIDSTILLEKPKLRDYIDQIRLNIANLLHTDIANVSVKATTGEGIGIVGESKAIICDTIVLVDKI